MQPKYAATTEPTDASIWLADAKAQCYIAADVTGHDAMLSRLLRLAVETVESDANRALLQRTIEYKMDRWPQCSSRYFDVPLGPLSSVTSIQYVDTDGNTQTWDAANYEAETSHQPGRIYRAFNVSWPSLRDVQNAVIVTYVAGSTQPNVPEIAKQAVMLLVAHAFENREILSERSAMEKPQGYSAMIQRISFGEWIN